MVCIELKTRLLVVIGALAIGFANARQANAVDARYWTLTPYNVRALLVVDSHTASSETLATELSERTLERADAAVGPLWNLSVQTLKGAVALEAIAGLGEQQLKSLAVASADQALSVGEDESESGDESSAEDEPATKENEESEEQASRAVSMVDKLVVLTLREESRGWIATAFEYDPLLEHVGQTQTAPACETFELSDVAFGLLVDVFSPVALMEVDRTTGLDARLSFRGSQLTQRPSMPDWGAPGAILLPVLRRTDREGNVVEDGVKPAPWTYLLTTDQPKVDGAVHAKIYSHSKRPFGVRRRGRVQQYALLLHPGDQRTQIHLHARGNPDLPLSGYRAYVQDGEEGERVLIGTTDSAGNITVNPGQAPIQYVYIKSGSQVVAKAPAPVGAIATITIPLPDERARIEAEARLSLLREELIDLVARRSILVSRIRDHVRKGDKQSARQLLATLDNLPGRAQFNQKLRRAQQQSTSNDPKVQQRIDRLFADTTAVLGAFLGGGQVEQLRREIDAAPDS